MVSAINAILGIVQCEQGQYGIALLSNHAKKETFCPSCAESMKRLHYFTKCHYIYRSITSSCIQLQIYKSDIDFTVRKMQRGSVGRPSGTDGSDFSYRMTVDRRFEKAAQRRAQLYRLLLAQAACQVLQILWANYVILKGKEISRTTLFSIAMGVVALLSGELGRRKSNSVLLKLYMFASSMTTVLLLMFGNIIRLSSQSSERDMVLIVLDIMMKAGAIAGAMVQIIAVFVTDSLMTNMSMKRSD